MYQNVCPLTQSFFVAPTHHMFTHTIAPPLALQNLLLKMLVIPSTPMGAFMIVVEIMCDPIDPPLFFSLFCNVSMMKPLTITKTLRTCKLPMMVMLPLKNKINQELQSS
jgi:hypothetical protein